jgi:hypothetical protein
VRRLAWAWLVVSTLGCSGNGGGQLSASQAATVCVIAEACFPSEWASGFFGENLAACASGGETLPPTPGTLIGSQAVTTGLEGPLGGIYRCVASAGGDCGKAGDCFGADGTTGRCAPPDSLEDGSCNGSVLSGCTSDGIAFDVDCAAYGETCHVDPILLGKAGVCDLGDCPAPTLCVGSKEQACEGAGFFLVDCARAGLSCVEPSDGGDAECVGSGSCDGGAATCDGTVIVGCSSGVPTREDCAQNPTFQRCEAGACVETGNECTVAGDPASCDGTSVKLCQDGTYQQVDCVGLGFAGCQDGGCTT